MQPPVQPKTLLRPPAWWFFEVTQTVFAAIIVGMMVFALVQIAALVLCAGAVIYSMWLTHRAVAEFEGLMCKLTAVVGGSGNHSCRENR
jgi:hypothetical protein